MTTVPLADHHLELPTLLSPYLRTAGFDAHAVHNGELGAAAPMPTVSPFRRTDLSDRPYQR